MKKAWYLTDVSMVNHNYIEQVFDNKEDAIEAGKDIIDDMLEMDKDATVHVLYGELNEDGYIGFDDAEEEILIQK